MIFLVLALLALLLVLLSFLPRFDVLHRVATVLLALLLVGYFAERA